LNSYAVLASSGITFTGTTTVTNGSYGSSPYSNEPKVTKIEM